MILGFVFSFLAALLWGTNHVLIKFGVSNLTSPLVGATFSTMTGAIMLSTIAARDFSPIFKKEKKALLFIMIAGVAASVGLGSQFVAFSFAPVIIVSPISCTYPIITVVLAHVFLKRTEKVTPRVVVGALFVIVGVTLITLGRP
ncbi:MAG: DMT family transporter [Dehalococcoidia bacterium]|nr:DMT family transporter [Dehalococcoidia bacterium]MDZ4247461.1 DMT family transporter [Dehalococcoidia bacterium]